MRKYAIYSSEYLVLCGKLSIFAAQSHLKKWYFCDKSRFEKCID